VASSPDPSDSRPSGDEVVRRRSAVPRSARQGVDRHMPVDEPRPTGTDQGANGVPGTNDPQHDGAPPRTAGRHLPTAIAVGVVLGALFLGSIFHSALAFTIVVAGFVVLASVEASAELRRIGVPVSVPAIVLGGLVTVFGAYRAGRAGQVAGMLVLFAGTVVWLLADPQRRHVVRNLGASLLLGTWTGLLGSFGVLLMLVPAEGAVAVLAVVGATAFGDIGAYAVGVTLGRTRIAPSVSPNKTLEGLIGGVVVAGGLAAIVLPLVGDLFTPVSAAIVAVVSVLAGFFGDLTESMVKRDLGIKDFGSLLPGHGGILDRVDGILMAMPVGFYAIALLT
jgi:phosphatidate cytidylyltransferase